MKLLIVVGIVVLLAGVSLILSAFDIHLPLFRTALGFVLAWFGLSLLLSAAGMERPWLAFQPERRPARAPQPSSERQDVMFSNQDLDITHIRPGDHVKLGVIFGDATVRYDPKVPLTLHSSTAFGQTRYPDGSAIAFGERTVRTPDVEGIEPATVDVATVFGTTRFLPVAVEH